MGYLHIENLYKYPDIFLFKEVYALEKIHGTSAHIAWKNGGLGLFSGGEKPEKFAALFDKEALRIKFGALGHPDVIVFGEGYGGKCQGMSHTYGPSFKFIVFEVKIGDAWLSVPNAADVAGKLGLEFVHYVKIPATIEAMNAERDAMSVQTVRNGITEPKPREGIVLRPLVELHRNDGSRIIAKHKGEAFQETRIPREVAPDKLAVLKVAQEIADEWVTPMRLAHVLGKLPEADITQTGDVAKAMLEDVRREAGVEVEWGREAERAVCTRAAQMFKAGLASRRPK